MVEARTLKHLIFQQRNTPVPSFVHITRVTNQNFEEMKKRNVDKIKITLDQK